MSNQPASGCVTQNDRIIEYSALCSAVIHFESIIYLFIMPHISNTAFKVQSSTLVEKKVFFLFVYALCCISKQTLIKPTLYLNRELSRTSHTGSSPLPSVLLQKLSFCYCLWGCSHLFVFIFWSLSIILCCKKCYVFTNCIILLTAPFK